MVLEGCYHVVKQYKWPEINNGMYYKSYGYAAKYSIGIQGL